MSTKGNLTREEAVEIVGENAVTKVERINCEPTGRVGYNGMSQGDDLCEWCASTTVVDDDGEVRSLRVYYYTTNEEDETMAEAEADGSVIDWEICGYEVV